MPNGQTSNVERQTILAEAAKAGIHDLVDAEWVRPTPLSAIVGEITDPQQRADLYVLAYAIVRADETVNGAERIYLAQLASEAQPRQDDDGTAGAGCGRPDRTGTGASVRVSPRTSTRPDSYDPANRPFDRETSTIPSGPREGADSANHPCSVFDAIELRVKRRRGNGR